MAEARFTLVVLVLAGVALAGCAVGPDYTPPAPQAPDRFTNLDSTLYSEAEVAAPFWQALADETLTSLIDEGLRANHDVHIAAARLKEAGALRGESQFDLFPTVTASAGYTRQRTSAALTPANAPRTQSAYDAGLDAFWLLDVFGGIRRGIEAREADVGRAQAQLRDVQLVVSAQIARRYYETRELQERLRVARRNVENQQASVDLTLARLQYGRGTEFDSARAQSQLESTLATIGPLETQLRIALNRIAVLIARPPTALDELLSAPEQRLALPELTAIGAPDALLRRRPDVRVAERELAGETARIGVAMSDLFPKITFTGLLGVAALNGSDLTSRGADTYIAAPAISWAAFDLGRANARVRGARARTDAAFARYQQTVLQALEDVDNALVAHARSRTTYDHVSRAAEASARAARLARLRFEGGAADFLQVLDAERTQLEAEDRLAQSRADMATSLVVLYEALAGGW